MDNLYKPVDLVPGPAHPIYDDHGNIVGWHRDCVPIYYAGLLEYPKEWICDDQEDTENNDE